MTMPNLSSPDDMPDAVNAGGGLSEASTTSGANALQGQMSQIGGPLGSVAGWLLNGLAGRTIDAAVESVGDSPTNSYTSAASKVFDNIVGTRSQVTSPLDLLAQAFTGNGSGLTGVFSSVASLFSGRWDQADQNESRIADLQDKTQVLEGIIGHASAWMASSPGTTTSATRMPFTSRSGPLVGVENLGDGRWRLLSRGSWDITAQVEFWGGAFMPPGTYMRIVTRAPDGSIFKRRTAKADTTANVTVTNVENVVVPAAGYTVEVEAWTDSFPLGGTFRGISGGFETTGLYIRKVSQETS